MHAANAHFQERGHLAPELAPILPVLAAWLKPFRKPAGKVLESVRDEFALAAPFKTAVDAIKGGAGKPLLNNCEKRLDRSASLMGYHPPRKLRIGSPAWFRCRVDFGIRVKDF